MDTWDFIGAVGFCSVVAGVAAVYWPAALILVGSCLCGAYYLAEKRRVP